MEINITKSRHDVDIVRVRIGRSSNSKNRVIASNTKDYSWRIIRRISADSWGASSASLDKPFAFVLYSESLDEAFLRGGSACYVRACIGKDSTWEYNSRGNAQANGHRDCYMASDDAIKESTLSGVLVGGHRTIKSILRDDVIFFIDDASSISSSGRDGV